MTAQTKESLRYFFEIFSVFVLLGLSAFCFQLYADKLKVLGVKTESKEEVFWQEFLSKNPDYLPGWLEIDRLDKVYKINPNFSEPLP